MRQVEQCRPYDRFSTCRPQGPPARRVHSQSTVANKEHPTRAVVEQACQVVRQRSEDHRPDERSVGFDGEESRRVNRAVVAKETDRTEGLSPQRKPTQRSAPSVFSNERGGCRASQAAERLTRLTRAPQLRQHPAGFARQHASIRLTSATNRPIRANRRTTDVPTKSHRLCDFSATRIFHVQIVLPDTQPPRSAPQPTPAGSQRIAGG
jgi:hypothetical protein